MRSAGSTLGTREERVRMDHLRDYLQGPWGRVALLTFTSVGAGEALVAIWAAKSRAHWLIRALALWGGIMLLVPISAYEPAAIFAVASPLIVGGLTLAGWVSQRPIKVCDAGADEQPAASRLRLWDGYDLAVLGALGVVALETVYQG